MYFPSIPRATQHSGQYVPSAVQQHSISCLAVCHARVPAEERQPPSSVAWHAAGGMVTGGAGSREGLAQTRPRRP